MVTIANTDHLMRWTDKHMNLKKNLQFTVICVESNVILKVGNYMKQVPLLCNDLMLCPESMKNLTYIVLQR